MEEIKLAIATIQGHAAGPRMLITGGVHGDEFEPMVAIRRLRRELDASKLRGQLVLVPIANEPAFERKHRCASDGLDLARTFPGDAHGTITQQVAHQVTQLIRSADFYIDLHTGGTTMSVWPLAGYCLHPDQRVLAVQRQMAQAFNLPVVWGTDPSLQGRSLSVARDANVPAIYTEYLGAANCSRAGVEAYVQGCKQVMAALGMLELSAPVSAVRFTIEDDRPSSGHMQIQNPAPCSGYFETQVELGQVLRPGDLIGTISDPLGDRLVEVRTPTGGLVLVLRTFPRVDQGEALAVVVETER